MWVPRTQTESSSIIGPDDFGFFLPWSDFAMVLPPQAGS